MGAALLARRLGWLHQRRRLILPAEANLLLRNLLAMLDGHPAERPVEIEKESQSEGEQEHEKEPSPPRAFVR